MSQLIENITQSMGDLDDDKVYQLVQEALDNGASKLDIIAGLQKGMGIVGELFSSNEYYVADLAFSAEIFEEASKLFGDDDNGESLYGKFVLGTVYTDLHDIGKNIVHSIFKCNGFEVIDLGIDVEPETFIEAIKAHDPKVVGISALLTTSFEPMKDVITQIREAGLAEGRLILIGGAPIDQHTCEHVGADDFVNDAQKGFEKARAFVENN